MEGKHILLVEDDVNFGSVLKHYLELHEFEVTLCNNGSNGLEAFEKNTYNLCLLDVMMPLKDGLSLAKEIRALNLIVPIIFITAKTLRDDIIKGYQTGADDYITKPFDSEVLIYKIKAMLSRSTTEDTTPQPSTHEFQIGSYQFNYDTRIIARNGEEKKLSPKEASLLRLLCSSPKGVLPRHEALMSIWKEDNYFTARSMDVFIFKLRKYLGDDSNVEIVNLHGNGFRLLVRNENEG